MATTEWEGWQAIGERLKTDGYDALDDHERVWLNVRSFADQMEAGGITAYFYHPWTGALDDLLAALALLDASEVQHQVARVARLFEGGVPADDDERNEAMERWADEANEKLLERIDDDLLPRMPDLEARLAAYLRREGVLDPDG